MHHSHSRGEHSRKEIAKAFETVIHIYADCFCLPTLSACNYSGKPCHRLNAGSRALDFVMDVEIANRVLDTEELKVEWRRLLEEQIKARDIPKEERAVRKTTRSSEQQKLMNRVVLRCGRVYVKKRLNRIGEYFGPLKLGADV